MAKFGMKKGSVHDRADAEQVAHKHVPGRAYEVGDAVTKLVHTIGGGFFNEPKYYDSNRSFAAFYQELLATGRISSKITDETGLTEQAESPRDHDRGGQRGDAGRPADHRRLGTGYGQRPETAEHAQIALALAAAHAKTRPFVARYATAIMQPADEIRQVFGAFRELFMAAKGEQEASQAGNGSKPRAHRGSLPHSLRKALAHALATQTEYALLKYDGKTRPTFADVLKMVGGPRRSASTWRKSPARSARLAGRQGDVRVPRQRPIHRRPASHA